MVIPKAVGAPSVPYTLTAKLTTLTANLDGDGVPDVADRCKSKKGPINSGGCPDTDGDGILDIKDKCAKAASGHADGCPTAADEKLVAFLDGEQISSTHAMSRHGRYAATGSFEAPRGTHTLKLVWYSGSKVLQTVSRSVTVR
jgi:hypothetical protein